MSYAVKKYPLNREGIINCCNHKQVSSGKDRKTGKKLHWIYTKDYINLKKQYDKNEILSLHISMVSKAKRKITRKHSDETREKMSNNHADFSGNKNPSAKRVYCLELDEYFDTMKDAFLKYGIDRNSICSCCTGNRSSAGKHPITKEKLHWRYA